MYKIFLILLLCFSSSFANRTIITVTHPIQEFLVKKIADDRIYIRTVFDKSHNFQATNKKLINKLANSDFYFILDLEEEKEIIELFKLENKNLKVINTTKNVGNLKMDDGTKNPYVWLDPILTRDVAKNIYNELVKIRYYDRVEFKENYERFLEELDEVYLGLKNRLHNSNLYGFFVFNNHLDYFAKRYRLNIYHNENRHLKLEEVPSIIELSRKDYIKHIVIPKDSPYKIAQSLNGHIDGKIIELDIYDINWKINLYALVRALSNF